MRSRRKRLTARAVLLTLLAVACNGDEKPSADSISSTVFQVGEIRIHISEGVEAIAARLNVDVDETVKVATERVVSLLKSPPADVYISDDPTGAIPEVGVGGRTDPVDGVVVIEIDPQHAAVRDALMTWLPYIVAHELHQSKRIIDGPGYALTLSELVITEGMADAFAADVFPEYLRAPWTRALDREQQSKFSEKLRRNLLRRYTQTLHRTWFFGLNQVPRWTGYTLGFEIVTDYERAKKRTAGDLVTTPARDLVAWLTKRL